MENKCDVVSGEIKSVVMFYASDWTTDKDGKPRLKRKYGKFKRLGYRVPVSSLNPSNEK